MVPWISGIIIMARLSKQLWEVFRLHVFEKKSIFAGAMGKWITWIGVGFIKF
jgi:hypothetical protein